ncbi:MAG: DUF58 domain-containing protein [Candidatus Dormibacteraeota bacterium]|nr:DUF58 domain-containing protein [Candidatus Dormibacteraeota bacterium]
MTTRISGRVRGYLALGGAGLLLALLTARPEPGVLALPFILALAAGLALARPPRLEIEARLARERAMEGEEVDLEVRVQAIGAAASGLSVGLRTPTGLRAQKLPPAGPERLGPGQTGVYRWRLACSRWGGRRPLQVLVRASDPLRLFGYTLPAFEPPPLRVYPRPETLRRLLPPAQTQAFAGNEVSRRWGDGIEFGEVRPFVPGDRVRRVNWRVSARRGHIHVNDMRPERNADVVIFLDTFSRVGDGAETALDRSVRAAGALATAYLRRRDRVGVIGFGGTLRWLRPEMGERQLYRIVDTLIDTEIHVSYVWKGLEVIPGRTLPPSALVLALSPLLDSRAVHALLDLRGRGRDLCLIELPATDYVRPGRRPAEQLAFRLWELEAEALRSRFLALGVPVVPWSGDGSLQAVLATAAEFRRGVRSVAR